MIATAVTLFLFAAALLMLAKAWALVRRVNRAEGRTFFGRLRTPQPPNPFTREP